MMGYGRISPPGRARETKAASLAADPYREKRHFVMAITFKGLVRRHKKGYSEPEAAKWAVIGGAMRPDSDNSAAVQDGVIPSFDLNEVIKRVLDVVAAIIGIILFAPILVIASVAVKIGSRGPIFVRKMKYGYDNRAIRVLKFRIMAARIDPRVTQVGQILSQTGIDELPQLFHVLRGEMSILGRRKVLRWPASFC